MIVEPNVKPMDAQAGGADPDRIGPRGSTSLNGQADRSPQLADEVGRGGSDERGEVGCAGRRAG